MIQRSTRGILACALLLAAAIPAVAAPATIGSFGDWSAITDGEGAKKICYAGSVPKKQEGKYTSRGDVHVLVTHRPADKVQGEVSVTAGYTYKDGGEAEVEIEGRKFKLFTRGGNAWATNSAADKAIMAAMKGGREMIVRGTSSRGTATTDTYSLSGFSAAMVAIDKACD